MALGFFLVDHSSTACCINASCCCHGNQVNGVSLAGMSHKEAVSALRIASSPVRLRVLRENPEEIFTTTEGTYKNKPLVMTSSALSSSRGRSVFLIITTILFFFLARRADYQYLDGDTYCTFVSVPPDLSFAYDPMRTLLSTAG